MHYMRANHQTQLKGRKFPREDVFQAFFEKGEEENSLPWPLWQHPVSSISPKRWRWDGGDNDILSGVEYRKMHSVGAVVEWQ